jgi:ureidoacrylate peracid hydrolase
MEVRGADITRSALLVIDMQNDFVHPEGGFGRLAKQLPPGAIDFDFLSSPIRNVGRLVDAYRAHGRPVIHFAVSVRKDMSDAAYPFWRPGVQLDEEFLTEGSWGANVVDALKPAAGEHLIIKKGFDAFRGTPLTTVLANLGVDTCVVAGVTTCICVSSTVRGGVAEGKRMVVVKDACAEVQRALHESELQTLGRIFADVVSVDDVVRKVAEASR